MGVNYVFSEGTKTEPHYVEELKKDIADRYHIRPNDIRIFASVSRYPKNTVDLLKFAEDTVNKAKSKGKWVDNVWIFFDKDDFEEAKYKKVFEETNRLNTRKTGNAYRFPCDSDGTAWIACGSNRCFELLFCLYFSYFQTKVSSTQDYIDFLNSQMKAQGIKYEKSCPCIHSSLTHCGGSIQKAIKNGRKLSLCNGHENPSTEAYLFCEFVFKYLKESQEK